MNDIYKNAFTTVKTGDPDYYDDVTVDEMMTELGQATHVPWFQQAYNKFVDGQRFADQIPGTRTYSGLTLGSRHQPDKLSGLQKNIIHDTNRFLTKDMRDAGMKEPSTWHVPRDDIDYYMQTGKLPKALAAHAADADLKGISVPKRQDDGSFVDAQGNALMHDDFNKTLEGLELLKSPLLLLLLKDLLSLLLLVLLLLLLLLLLVLLLNNLLAQVKKEKFN